MVDNLKVLMVHNRYRIRGGEDSVFAAEVELLRDNGIVVLDYIEDNQTITSSLTAARRAIWSPESYRAIRDLLRKFHADVVHVHNFFPLISPAVYSAAHASGAAVVQTLHNYRLFCINGNFLREEKICKDCFHRCPLPGVLHKCYRDSRAGSAVAVAMLMAHRFRRTWQKEVDAFIALSPFSRDLFIQGGLPEEKIHLRPNYVSPDPMIPTLERHGALFIGRLSVEKGLRVLLDAWEMSKTTIPLRIIGYGPLLDEVRSKAQGIKNIEILGQQPPDQVFSELCRAKFLVFPSIWFEGMPRTILEAFACGTPVIASKLGAMTDLVQEGQTGRLFEAGNASDLARVLKEVWQTPAQLEEMGAMARSVYIEKYTAKPAFASLLEIYQKAMEQHDTAAP